MKFRELLQLIGWQIINPFLLKRKKRRLYHFNEKFRGINLGCGLDNPPNWVGIDGGITHILMSKLPKFLAKKIFSKFSMKKNYTFEEYCKKIKSIPLIHHDLRYGIPLNDKVVPHIYSSHFLEHLSRNDAEVLLKNCFRVLKPGGIIRIAVPSLEQTVLEIKASIIAYDKGDYNKIQPYVTSKKYDYLSQYSSHRYMYNFHSLKESLENTGFIEVKEFQMKRGNIPDVEKLDTRPSLFVEAIKPKIVT
ncbi:MAG: methyltransferase domain-containing protein [Candidatus Odinarchaeota archaeon]